MNQESSEELKLPERLDRLCRDLDALRADRQEMMQKLIDQVNGLTERVLSLLEANAGAVPKSSSKVSSDVRHIDGGTS